MGVCYSENRFNEDDESINIFPERFGFSQSTEWQDDIEIILRNRIVRCHSILTSNSMIYVDASVIEVGDEFMIQNEAIEYYHPVKSRLRRYLDISRSIHRSLRENGAKLVLIPSPPPLSSKATVKSTSAATLPIASTITMDDIVGWEDTTAIVEVT